MTCHALISGFVQGIGFRAFVKSKAQDLDLKGWATNTSDGKVEIMFVGSREKIEKMIKLCKKGPFLANVRDVKVEWKDRDENYDSFEIVR